MRCSEPDRWRWSGPAHGRAAVLLGVPDAAVLGELAAAAAAGAQGAVVFGSAHAPGLRAELASHAAAAGMALCGAGRMGFVNNATGTP